MIIYLIHFTRKYRHAQHYLGSTEDLGRRIAEHQREYHRKGLLAAVNRAKIPWLVARTWEAPDRELEYQLKAWHGSARFCPVCRALAGLESPAIVPPVSTRSLSPTRATPSTSPSSPTRGMAEPASIRILESAL